MTGELRRYLKGAIDARVRELAADNAWDGTCSGCGAPHDDLTPDCRTCRSRHARRGHEYNRYRRQDELSVARQAARRARWRVVKAQERERRRSMSESLPELQRAA